MEKVNEQQQPKTSSNNDQKRNEIWKVLNEARFPHDRHDYNGSFDDGNHPGDSSEYEIGKKRVEEETWEIAFHLDEDHTDANVFERVQEHQAMFPLIDTIIPKMKSGKTISFLMKQEKIEQKWWRNEAVGPAIPAEELYNLGETFARQKNALIGTKATYITFRPIKQDPLTVNITATIIEYPVTSGNKDKDIKQISLLPNYIIFKKEIKGEEVKEFLKNVA